MSFLLILFVCLNVAVYDSNCVVQNIKNMIADFNTSAAAWVDLAEQSVVFMTDLMLAMSTAHTGFLAAGAIGKLIQQGANIQSDEMKMLKEIKLEIKESMQKLENLIQMTSFVQSHNDKVQVPLYRLGDAFKRALNNPTNDNRNEFLEYCKKEDPNKAMMDLHAYVTGQIQGNQLLGAIMDNAVQRKNQQFIIGWTKFFVIEANTATKYTQACYKGLGKSDEYAQEALDRHIAKTREIFAACSKAYEQFLANIASDIASGACEKYGSAPATGGSKLYDDLSKTVNLTTWIILSRADFGGEDESGWNWNDYGWPWKGSSGNVHMDDGPRITGVYQRCGRTANYINSDPGALKLWTYTVFWCENVKSSIDPKVSVSSNFLEQVEKELKDLPPGPHCADFYYLAEKSPAFREATTRYINRAGEFWWAFSPHKKDFSTKSLCTAWLKICKNTQEIFVAFNLKLYES